MSSPRALVSLLFASSCLASAACSDDGSAQADPSAETGESSGDGDGDPSASDSAEGDSAEGDGDGDPSTGDGDGDNLPELPSWPTLECDPLVPELCGFPFPNNVFSRADASSETGRRLALSEALMPTAGQPPDPATFNLSDGFSPASTMLAFFPGGTTTGLPTPLSIADSLAPDSPTILLDADRGERVPHWAEYDMSHPNSDRRAFMIRPAVRLEPATRYIVAVRGIVDAEGAPLPASPAFAALRDPSPSELPSIDERRDHYELLFSELDAAGVAREDLQLAWDFSTASDTNITERAVHVVEAGLAALPPEGPSYVIDSVIDDPAPGIAMRIELRMTVPLFLDSPEAGGVFVYGDDGLPTQTGTAEYPVLVHVPSSAAQAPARLMAYGHGQLGSRFEILADHLEQMAASENVIMFATDWVGMASDDQENILSILATGRIDDFHAVPDRLQQGFLNAFAAMRMMQTRFAADPIMQGEQGSMVDPVEPWYFGGSQGGIYGTSYMALSPDVSRGVVAVPGQPYSLLLNRSVNFEPFFDLMQGTYPDTLDLRFMLEIIQIEWDRAEPTGYTRHVIDDPLPNAYEKEILMLVSIGDHQVTTLGAHMMARELGIPQIAPAPRPDLFGIDSVEGPYMGSAMIEYEWGLPPEPIQNIPMSEGEDPHGKLADIPSAAMTVVDFLRTGVVDTYCDGICDPD